MMQHMAENVEHIYLALGYTDFRRQIAGLTAMVALQLKWILIPEIHSSYSVISVIQQSKH